MHELHKFPRASGGFNLERCPAGLSDCGFLRPLPGWYVHTGPSRGSGELAPSTGTVTLDNVEKISARNAGNFVE